MKILFLEVPGAEAKKAAALPIVPIAVGVAVLAVLLAAILLAAKKSKAVKMKKNVGCILLFLVSTSAFSQTILYKGEQIFLIANDYEIIHDCNAYEIDKQAKKFVKTETIIEKGHVVTSEIYEKFWGISTLGIGNNKFIDTPDYKIAENDSFPAQSVCSVVNAETSARWIPEWYFYALERKDRNLIAEAEPGRDTWDGDAIPDVWYKAIPQVSSLVLTNAGMTMYTPLQAQAVFLFQNLKKNPDGKFEATAYPDINDTDNDVFWKPNKENFPALQNGSPVKFRFEINGKEMKIYNGETGKLCFDLIQMPAEWAVLYEDFIRTNKVPAGLYLPEEYLKRKNGGSPGGDDSAKKGPELTDALITAAKNNNAAKARRLIAAGADVNAKDDDGKTALMLAAWANSVDIVKLLLAADADVNAKDEDGWTALIYAAARDAVDVARLLLAAGADMNAKDNYDNSALMRAAARYAMDAVRLLLAAGADVNGINRNGGTALMNAAVGNSADVVRLLIESGADMNAQDEFGWTALMCAARENSADVAEILLDAGADVNTKADGGRTALMCAAARDAVDVVKLLLAAGADVDAKLNNGATALMLAAQYNFMDAARLLIAAGADMSAKDNRGRSALMLATEFKAADVAELLRAADRESADAPAVGKTAAVTENLRLRTDNRTTAEVVATLAAGTRVKVEATGRGDTIDGIASNWVRVSVLSGARDKDGNAVAAGTEGWLFGGYLSAAHVLPIALVVAGVAVLAILLAAILLAVRKKKGGKE